MSPKNEVFPLSYIAIKSITTPLLHALSDDEGIHHEVIENYFRDATGEVLQDLLKYILATEGLDASTRFSCLQVLLREDVKRLDTGVFPHSYYDKILNVITRRGRGLQHLNLKGVWLREKTEQLAEVISTLHNLKVLIIPHMTDDIVLTSVSKCASISVLNISGECAYTKEGLRKLKCDSLSVLDIGYFGKEELWENSGESYETIAHLIENMPNLIVLKTYSYAGKALLHLYNKNKNFKTKLKYIHDTDTNLVSLEAIVKTCPTLESVNLISPEEEVVKNLYRISKLSSVKLSKPDCKEVVEFLSASRNVQVLKLSLVRERSLDVSEICLTAPDIIRLECFKMSLICLRPDSYFMNLQFLEVLYCGVSSAVLKYLLVNSPFLKRVVVGDELHMTDGDVFRLCAECDFLNLEELWFSSAKGLTVTSIELLMGHCPNLKVLGQLSGWDVTSNDIDYLKAVIVSTNTDLTLLL